MSNNISKIKLFDEIYEINAMTVNGHTVLKSVPSDAKFTDTTYVFNTPYDATTNPAVTMEDLRAATVGVMEAYY